MMVYVAIQEKFNKAMRIGIYLFAVIQWVSHIGYTLFPLSESGTAGTAFQDIMHVYVVAMGIIILCVTSLVLIIIGGNRDKSFVSLAMCATTALALMLVGAIGVNLALEGHFGIFERFSPFAITRLNAVLGMYLFAGRFR